MIRWVFADREWRELQTVVGEPQDVVALAPSIPEARFLVGFTSEGRPIEVMTIGPVEDEPTREDWEELLSMMKPR